MQDAEEEGEIRLSGRLFTCCVEGFRGLTKGQGLWIFIILDPELLLSGEGSEFKASSHMTLGNSRFLWGKDMALAASAAVSSVAPTSESVVQ